MEEWNSGMMNVLNIIPFFTPLKVENATLYF